ncbi:UDP-N-acetylglucosamine--N-acetylmuramyl-(pentapeptide) pyrophosphoryl-undecaprenol N-acetylglucosamine transferase [Nocardiopsis composta]|uniref:UDP-N-acetylglucosamine--N-acetylmuramyl-(pentapeptide) pyrophosphoryl-undecaprenol N-acetylglucosamine transferase n=1 Tax=Nocardiopsis composta TaxID=157465 RepID=A0A7W8QML9_9ACTN|nr:UDP-N-acetylglucosamine--N-acetylmuramyl-(pentapeptide) pyrophosphoryl-undecaprenol N-acetylglucosamine transferase [Nocardiopsis composta]MBB5433262.1 UDP-N-acetylglucosamine--N-acetylmuramyl-(pentapeptide) pyrophosphoryl-undecaprenol N-acetylglucosamine transferase [Nocardiopsis composta]
MADTTDAGLTGDTAPCVLIGAGGTGGHIYPGLALARAVRRAAPGARVAFFGTGRGLETRLVPEAGFELHTVDMVPMSRGHLMRFPFALAASVRQAGEIIAATRAGVAIGMGGYSSAPLIAAARLAGVPALIHESNAVPGRANRFSARFTRNVALAFAEAAEYFPDAQRCRAVGMPLAPELAAFDRDALRAGARERFGVPDGAALVLVNGGSQGATRINAAAVELAGRWRHRDDVRFLIKAGAEGAEELERRLWACGGTRIARAVGYLDRMDLAYAAADVALGRAGSATVAELARVGLPSVLVPYPHAPLDHQTRNARALADRGAAVLLPDADTDAERLGPLLHDLVTDAGRRERMAAAARDGSNAGAADELAAWVLDLCPAAAGRPA